MLQNYSLALRDIEENQQNHIVIEKLSKLIIDSGATVFIIGIGKSGYIARKAASSMVSTGTKAFFLHPSEALHGDIGAVTASDICIFISYSGESIELIPVMQKLKNDGVKCAAFVANEESTLAKHADFIVKIPKVTEPTSLPAPFVSTVATLILLDLLCIALINNKNFTIDQYKYNHPAGKIGSILKNVSEIMYTDEKLPIVSKNMKMADALVVMTSKRLGSLVVVDEKNALLGVVSDGDLRRHMSDHLTTEIVEKIMTLSPKVISPNALCSDAFNVMRKNKITSLVVVNHDNIVVGFVHIHQLLELFGDEQ